MSDHALDTIDDRENDDLAIADQQERNRRRDEIAGTVFSAWIVTRLFVDGWAHNVNKPEDFFTPWHLILYSGFVTSFVWLSAERYRRRRAGLTMTTSRLVVVGYGLFAVGGVADGAWHQVFGVEVDLEALLSPTHLLLMVGGLLLATESVRSMIDRDTPAPGLRLFLPAVGGITTAIAVVAFFTQFANAFRIFDPVIFSSFATEEQQGHGVALVLLTNILLMGALVWTTRRWTTPPGTFTLMFGLTALLISTQSGFDQAWLVGPAVLGGLTADTLLARRAALRTVVLVTPAVLWVTWFAVYHGVWGLGWPAEMWTGTVFFAVLSGFALDALGDVPPRTGRPDSLSPDEAERAGTEDTAATPDLAGQLSRARTPHGALARLLLFRGSGRATPTAVTGSNAPHGRAAASYRIRPGHRG